jgi:hypothetical protein
MKVFANIVLILILVTIVVPVGYLAWRAGQPMELPQFNGLTYYEYLDWRKSTLHQIAVDYLAAYPNKQVQNEMCFQDETGMTLLGLPMTGFYSLVGIFPNLKKYIKESDRQYISQAVTFWTFLPVWWKTYEQFVWYMANSNIHSPVPYCRLAATPPVPTSVNP